MKRVLMAMVEVGNGHKAPAESVKRAMEELFPGEFFLHVSDFARESGALVSDRALKKAWESAGRHYRAFRFLYRLVELLPAPGRWYARVAYADFFEKGALFIRDFAPELVFSTYTISSFVAAYARRLYGLDYKLVVFVADPFDAYSWWVEKDADAFIVASTEAADRLASHGVVKDRIFVLPYPVRKDFESAGNNRNAICREFSLEPSNPILLASGGGMGLGKVASYTEHLVRSNLPLNIIFLAGRNRELYSRMKALEKADSVCRLRVLEYTDRVVELTSSCDVVMGKAGASTAMEAAVCCKPVIFTDWIAQNDLAIIKHFTDNGYGWYFKKPAKLVEFFSGNYRRRLEEASGRLRSAGYKSGVDDIARFLADFL
ncbi:glycosyltransferase [Spirochaetia bacterium 38H-sp]|uniref:Glycosyltransferase n=1 Tax=Rarispira pelagica TaxID=3141764 RepID=A0ABU9UA89_9SPIR